jgi:hypothetical protein
MYRICHRCHRDLPGNLAGHASSAFSASDDEHALFCPWCGAPQLQLQEHVRAELAADTSTRTTGAVPPPRPQMVDWMLVLNCVAPVALVTAVLVVFGQVYGLASFLSTLCVLGGPGIVLGLYRTRRPVARIDGKIGLRVGLLTGLLMVTAMGIALAATGVVERFGLHNMASFDDDFTKQLAQSQQASLQMAQQLSGTSLDAEAQKKQMHYLASPEFRAANALGILFTGGAFLLVLTTGFGGFAGLLQTRWRTLRPRD